MSILSHLTFQTYWYFVAWVGIEPALDDHCASTTFQIYWFCPLLTIIIFHLAFQMYWFFVEWVGVEPALDDHSASTSRSRSTGSSWHGSAWSLLSMIILFHLTFQIYWFFVVWVGMAPALNDHSASTSRFRFTGSSWRGSAWTLLLMMILLPARVSDPWVLRGVCRQGACPAASARLTRGQHDELGGSRT